MRRYSVLGISLMDVSAREGLRRAEHFLQTGALNTTSYINAQSLSMASRDEQVKEYLEETDLMFCLEPDILEAAGIASPGRVREIEDRMFLREFLKRLARQHDKVYLLGDTDKQAQELQEMLLNAQENLNIVDVRGYEEFEYQPQRLMNAMNEADFFPDDISAGSGADAQRPQIFKRGALGGVAGDEIKRKGEDDVLEKGAEKDFSEKS